MNYMYCVKRSLTIISLETEETRDVVLTSRNNGLSFRRSSFHVNYDDLSIHTV